LGWQPEKSKSATSQIRGDQSQQKQVFQLPGCRNSDMRVLKNKGTQTRKQFFDNKNAEFQTCDY
jgi:hypothetical protein